MTKTKTKTPNLEELDKLIDQANEDQEPFFVMSQSAIDTLMANAIKEYLQSARIPEGSKYRMIGEFIVAQEAVCHECYHHTPSDDCEVCGGDETYIESVDIPWTTMKDIFKKFCECAVDEMEAEGYEYKE